MSLAANLQNVVAEPDGMIVEAGATGTSMYWLTHGIAEVLSPEGRTVAIMRKGVCQ